MLSWYVESAVVVNGLLLHMRRSPTTEGWLVPGTGLLNVAQRCSIHVATECARLWLCARVRDALKVTFQLSTGCAVNSYSVPVDRVSPVIVTPSRAGSIACSGDQLAHCARSTPKSL